MAVDYNRAYKLLSEWDVADLKLGLWGVFRSMTEETLDENLILAFLDVLDEKDPLPPLPVRFKTYEDLKKAILEKNAPKPLPTGRGGERSDAGVGT